MLDPARLRAFTFAAGLALSAVLVARAQASGDQLNLLARGWLLAARGELVAYGNPLSSGGNAPGALTSVLVGAPLVLWRDHRAPVALIWLLHLGAYLALDRSLRAALTPFERAAFAVFYWLNPWRLTAAGFLWNPNYLLAVGAAHLVTAKALARRAGFWATFAHTLALGFGAQLHPAVLLLGVLSLLLWARGYLRFAWAGLAAGIGVTAVSLLPWLAAVAERPELAAADQGYLGRSLLLVAPFLKGLSYWLRLPSLMLPGELLRLDFGPFWGDGVDRWLTPVLRALLAAAGLGGVAFALWANAGLLRRWRELGRRWRPAPEDGDARAWLEGYVVLALAAAALVFAAAPTTPMSWQALPLLHAAVLPVAWGCGRLARRRGEAPALRALAIAAVVLLGANVALGLAAPNFRCGGRHAWTFPLAASSPMFEEIGLERTCAWPLGVAGGWWPDVLPREP